MSVLIIGGDNLGNIYDNLLGVGATSITHIRGRKEKGGKEARKLLPKQFDLMILFHNFANHQLARMAKKEAKKREVPIIYSRRSWRSIQVELKRHFPRLVKMKKNKNGANGGVS